MTTTKVLMLIAALGYALCFFCDCMLSYTPNRRRLELNCLNDGDKPAEQFEGMSLSYPMRSMLPGIPAIVMQYVAHPLDELESIHNRKVR